jgi:hypothetical protein
MFKNKVLHRPLRENGERKRAAAVRLDVAAAPTGDCRRVSAG